MGLKNSLLFAATAIFFLTSPLEVSFAAKKKIPVDTGLAMSLHDVAPQGRKLCMVSHAHDGRGVHKNKASAMRHAAKVWSSYTIEEYGTAWGRLSNATGVEKACSKYRGFWICYINARPCRMGGFTKRSSRKRKRRR
ncbi:MAG: hypothetical protein ACR2O4_18645 [Hyphomicrobiaceae bacterium]